MDRIEAIRKSLKVKNNNGKKSLSHTNKKAIFLPFFTRNPERAKFANGFEPVLGELFRKIEGLQMKGPADMQQVIGDILMEVDVSDEDRPHLETLLESYLYQAASIRLFHPVIIKYIPLSETADRTGEIEIAQFILDGLISDESKMKGIMQLTENEHVLTRLIYSHLPQLEKQEAKGEYAESFGFIREVFREDLDTLLDRREFFLAHISMFLAYYYFYSISQFTLKLNQYWDMDTHNPTPVFYNLDWEQTNRNRPATTKGFKAITESARRLLLHINTLEQLNLLLGVENQNYPELMDTYRAMAPEEKGHLIGVFNEWIAEYADVAVGGEELPERAESLEDAIRILQEQIVKAYEKPSMQGQSSRYALSLTEIGKLYFLKTRGSLGFTLNINQDFLLLLTALSVKHEKISLKQLFNEFERRGVFLDRYSREAVVELLNKLNLIEKKSDSGDAQYVKPIL